MDTVRFKVLAHAGSGWVLGLRQYSGKPADTFDETRLAWTIRLRGIECGGTRVMGVGASAAKRDVHTESGYTDRAVVVFRDPDNIQLEFWCPAGDE